MLSDERIIVEIALPIGSPFDRLALEYQTDEILKFARAIEREAIADFLNESWQYLTNDASREAVICEATAPLIEQIKEDEALMRQALKALLPDASSHTVETSQTIAVKALRERLGTRNDQQGE